MDITGKAPTPKLLLLALTTLLPLACSRPLAWASSEKVTWNFIQKNCGGIQVGEAKFYGSKVSIPIYVVDKLDSALCVFTAKGRVSGHQIEISARKGLCPGNNHTPLLVNISKPKSGEYQIVYADAEAGYPVIGSLHVE